MWTKPHQSEGPGSSAEGPALPAATFNANPDAHKTGLRARDRASLGSGLVIKGKITGTEDLQVDGKVEGPILLEGHQLTVGPAAQLNSKITACELIVYGKVLENVSARDRVDVRKNGSVTGDISTAHITIEDSAHFKGRIEIDSSESQSEESKGSSAVGVASWAA
jgi:cytoskeletal protein CcmA (bactofilin family)